MFSISFAFFSWFLFCNLNFRLTFDNLPGLAMPILLLTSITVASDKVKNLLLKADLRRLFLPEYAQQLDMSIIDLFKVLPTELKLVLTQAADIFGKAIGLRDLKI